VLLGVDKMRLTCGRERMWEEFRSRGGLAVVPGEIGIPTGCAHRTSDGKKVVAYRHSTYSPNTTIAGHSSHHSEVDAKSRTHFSTLCDATMAV
jgi:hypothetical protein